MLSLIITSSPCRHYLQLCILIHTKATNKSCEVIMVQSRPYYNNYKHSHGSTPEGTNIMIYTVGSPYG